MPQETVRSPLPTRSINPGVFSRIVRIADFYEALTSERPYRVRPFSRPQALETIADKSFRELDRNLFRIFTDVIGILPDNLDERLAVLLTETPEHGEMFDDPDHGPAD
jgi:HD-GYP domain-containing protein (c-di-GMP phosphodiesterase class II)